MAVLSSSNENQLSNERLRDSSSSAINLADTSFGSASTDRLALLDRQEILVASTQLVGITDGNGTVVTNPRRYLEQERATARLQHFKDRYAFHEQGESLISVEEIERITSEPNVERRKELFSAILLRTFAGAPGEMIEQIKSDPLEFFKGIAVDFVIGLTPVGGLWEAYQVGEAVFKTVQAVQELADTYEAISRPNTSQEELSYALRSGAGAMQQIAFNAMDVVIDVAATRSGKIFQQQIGKGKTNADVDTTPSRQNSGDVETDIETQSGSTQLDVPPAPDPMANVATLSSQAQSSFEVQGSVLVNGAITVDANGKASVKVGDRNISGQGLAEITIDGKKTPVVKLNESVFITAEGKGIYNSYDTGLVKGIPVLQPQIGVVANRPAGQVRYSVDPNNQTQIAVRSKEGDWSRTFKNTHYELASIKGEPFLKQRNGGNILFNGDVAIANGKRYNIQDGTQPTQFQYNEAIKVNIEGAPAVVTASGTVALQKTNGSYTPLGTPKRLGDQLVIVVKDGNISTAHYRDGRVAVKDATSNAGYSNPLPDGTPTNLLNKPGVQSNNGTLVALSGENGVRVKQNDGTYSAPISGKVSRLHGDYIVETKLPNSDIKAAYGTNGTMYVQASGKYNGPIGVSKTPPEMTVLPDGRLSTPLRDGNVAVIDKAGNISRVSQTELAQMKQVSNAPEQKAPANTTNVNTKTGTVNPLSPENADLAVFTKSLPEDVRSKMTPEQIKAAYEVSQPPKHFTGRANPNMATNTINNALLYAQDFPEAQVHYTQALIPANLAALNKNLGAEAVNNILKDTAKLDASFVAEIEALGGTASIVQGRGPEVHIITTGVNDAQLKGALGNWQTRVDQSLNKEVTSTSGKQINLSTLPHPKGDPNQAFGTPLLYSDPVSLTNNPMPTSEITSSSEQLINKQQPAQVIKADFRGTLPQSKLNELSQLESDLNRARERDSSKPQVLNTPANKERQQFIEQMKQSGLDEKSASEMFDTNRRIYDDRTGMIAGEMTDQALNDAVTAVRTTPGARSMVVEIDVGNIGGLNGVLGRAGTDALLVAPARMLEKNMRDLGIEVQAIRAGGDEFVYVTAGGKDLDIKVQQALELTKQQVNEINSLEITPDGKRISDIKNPKYPDDKGKTGLGLYWGVTEVTPVSNASSIRTVTGVKVEDMKAGR
jgi:GGDEF domain-containing protein